MPEDETTPTVDPQAGDTENLNPQAGESTTTTESQADESQQPETHYHSKKPRRYALKIATCAIVSKKLRTLKTEIAELKKFKEATETEKLSETEKQTNARLKLEKQLSEAQAALTRKETEVQEQKINNDIIAKAAKVGINPDLAAKVLDHSEIDYDEKGNPINVEDLLKDLLKSFPNLAAQQAQQRQASQSTAGGATNPGRAATSMPAEITQEYYERVTKDLAAFNALTLSERARIQQYIDKVRKGVK